MKLSVIILNYNVRYFLEQTLRSVERALQTIDAEIIVVDNNSADDSCAMVKTAFPEVTLIENKENVGFSKANNQGVKAAKGMYVCILNPDVAVGENTLVHCLNYMETAENVGAVGVYLMDGTGNFLPESKRNVPTPAISLLKLSGFSKKYYARHIDKEGKGEVDVLAGAFMFIKKSVYEEVGGFDEDYFMYGEDIDLSYKIKNAGYQNQYLGTATILHYKGESPQTDAVYFTRFYDAMRIFYRKHFSTNKVLNAALDVGLLLAKAKKSAAKKRKKKNATPIEQAILLTENLALLKQLAPKLDIPLKAGSKAMFQDQRYYNCMFIFDVEYMPYHQIFTVMKLNSNKNNIFRIRPPHTNFILGSDKSDEKGSVLIF